jgi:hypothetical protein
MKQTQVARRSFLGALGGAACGCACGTACAGAVAAADLCVDAICGIYCGACPALLSSKDAKTANEVKCLGCRSTKKSPGYAPKCEARKCAKAKLLQSCGLCKSYPCDKIAAMFNETPKYGLREKYLNAVRDKGMPAWLAEMKTRWACKKCGTAFGYGMTACKKCGEKVWSDAEEFAEFKKSKA